MNNKMSGKFTVLGYGESDIQGSMIVKVRKGSDMQSKISIRPHNKMAGIFDVIEPPLIINTLPSIKDSMVYNKIDTLNYGNEKSMLIGYNSETGDNYYSLIQFDLSTIAKNKELKYATLKLYNSLQQNDVELALCESLSHWDEDGVTWKNKPPIGDIVATGLAGSTQGYVEFDILSIVKEWYKGNKPNNGLILTLKDYALTFQNSDFTTLNVNEYVQFSTNQSDNPPVIETAYYEDVKSVGVSKLQSSINIRETTSKDLASTFQLNSQYKVENLPSTITIKQYSDNTTIDGSLTIRKKLLSDIQGNIQLVKKDRTNDISATMGIKYGSNLNSSLQLVKKNRESDLVSTLNVRASHGSNLASTFQIMKKNVDNDMTASLLIRGRDDLASTFTIEGKDRTNDLVSQIVIRGKSNIDSSIIIPYKSNLNSSIKVVYADAIPSSITVNSEYLRSQLMIQGKEDADLTSMLEVKVRRISEINSIMTVHQHSSIQAVMTVREIKESDIVSVITIRKEETTAYGYVFIL